MRLSASPYINHFLQPDTIIPNLASPQSWNRYSYVGNNPTKYSDPTGHIREEDIGSRSYSKSIDCKKNPEYCIDGEPMTSEILNGMRFLRPNTGIPSNPSICLACNPTPKFELGSDYTLSSQIRSNNSPELVYPPLYDTFQHAGDLYDDTFDILWFLAENGRYPYKLLRSLQVSPVQEAVTSGILQGIADVDNQLTPAQRMLRAGWAATEAGAIDFLTAPFIYATTASGIASGAFVDGPLPIGDVAGGVTSYVVSSVSYNAFANAASDKYITPWVYNTLQLYDPSGN